VTGRAGRSCSVSFCSRTPDGPALNPAQAGDLIRQPSASPPISFRAGSELRRAARRGEIRPGVVTSLLAQTGPALVINQQLHYGSPPSQAEITEIVDRVLLPALGAAAPG